MEVTVLVHLRLMPESMDKGKRDLLEFARIVRKSEPDCLSIEIAQDMDEPTRITMIEKWSDRGAYEGPHLETPHMKSFVEHSRQYFDGPAEVAFIQGIVVGRSERSAAPPYGR